MTIPAPAYTVDIKTRAGTAVLNDIPVSSVVYSKALNSQGAATFDLPIRYPGVTQTNIMPMQHTVKISRAGTAVWGGDITSARANVDSQMVSFTAEGYFARLSRRLITDDLYYKDVEQVNIAANLINYTNAIEASGVTVGTHTATGITRSRHWCCWQGNDIAQAIVDLAAADDGFDFDLDPFGTWTTYSPQKGSAVDVTFDTAGFNAPSAAQGNVYATTLEIDGSDIINQVFDIPQSEVCTDITVVSDATSDTAYGLLQEALNLTHVKKQTDRLHEMNEELRIRKRPHTTVEITTDHVPFVATAYDIGDNVKFTSAIGYCTFSAVTFRIMAYEVTVKDAAETARVTLDRYHHLA